MVNVAVIGAGIMGYSSAVNVQRALPKARVTIIADQFEHQLVSYGAGGLFRPMMDKHVTREEKQMIEQCIRDSWNHFSSLAMSEHAKVSGQMMVPGYVSHRQPMDEVYAMIKECIPDFRRVSEDELRRMKIPEKFKYTYFYTSVVSQLQIYIPWLKKQFEAKGGQIQKRTVHKLEELYGEYQLIINCCGLRAKTFLNDSECFPTRGQLAMVKAPWFRHFHYFDTDNYMIPHTDKLNIGGIRIHGDGNQNVDPEVTKELLRKAQALYPRLKGAEMVGEWAHSRPGRSKPRVEAEVLDLGENRKLTVIHNYGHGGHGITLSWGMGIHVAKLAKDALSRMVPKAAL